MARNMDNPDRRGKDMDMDDVRGADPCPVCRTTDPDDHGDGCPYGDD